MGTGSMNIWLRNSNCDLLTGCWRTDLVVQSCGSNAYLIDTFPEIIDQLKNRYAYPATAKTDNVFPLSTDQSGNTITIQVGTEAAQNHVFTSPAISIEEIYMQLRDNFTNCKFKISESEDNILVESLDRGPQATLSFSGDSDLVFNMITPGSGYTIKKHFYQSAWRIMLLPGNNKTLNHIEMDVPPGCYRVWTRVCHGENEETSVSRVGICCDSHVCVDLMLPALKTCAAHIIHPLMDKVVNEQLLMDDAERLLPFRAVMEVAGLNKQAVINQLDYRIEEAQDKGDTELEARINAVKNLAQLLNDCY